MNSTARVPVPPADSATQAHALNQPNATFAVVTYGGDKKTLVNTNCAIIHMLLHLRAKCIGDGFDISDNICIEGSRLNYRKKKTPGKGTRFYADDDDVEYLDLLDKEAVPLELSNRDPLSLARAHVKHRAEYVLCSVKKTRDGVIKDANPLLVRPSMDLRRRIHSVLRTMERFKTRAAEKTPRDVRRKGQTQKKVNKPDK